MSEQAIFRPEHVGQVVSEPRFGNGFIHDYNQGDEYPVAVYFADGSDLLYFKASGAYTSDVLPTLQFGPLDNWQRRTEPQLRDGDLVEVFDPNSSQWYIGTVTTDLGNGHWATITRSDDGTPLQMKILGSHRWRFFKP